MATPNTKSYAEKISQTKVMIDGLVENIQVMEKRGIDKNFVEEMQKRHEKVIVFNSEQEKLKAQLKSKTEALAGEITKMKKLHAEAKKLVKIQFPQEQWKEFGISDKR